MILHWVMHVQLDDQQERPVNSTTTRLDKRNFSQWYCWFICLLYRRNFKKYTESWELQVGTVYFPEVNWTLHSPPPTSLVKCKQTTTKFHCKPVHAALSIFTHFECFRSRGLPKVSRKFFYACSRWAIVRFIRPREPTVLANKNYTAASSWGR